MHREQPSTTPQCLIHNKPALFVSIQSQQSIILQKFPCEKCCNLYIYANTNTNTNTKSQNKIKYENLLNEIKINKKQLNVFEQMLIFYENNLLKEIKSFQKFIKDQYQLLIKFEWMQSKVDINSENLKKSENDLQMISKKLSSKLSDLSLASNINNFENILKLKQIKDFNDDTLSPNLRYNNEQEQQLFDIIPLTSTDHIKQSQAIAFSYDSLIMIAGYQNQIRIFDKKLNEIQILEEHKKNVSYLQFMKSNEQFVSCSMDGQIMFWDLNNGYGKWVLVQVINDSEHCVTCIKFNTQQNMFFSSGVDCLVKFYSKTSNNLWECFGKIACSSYVVDINLNKGSSKLFVCEYNNIVSVENQVDRQQKWSLQQQINVGEKILQIQSLSTKNFACYFKRIRKLKFFKNRKKDIQEFNKLIFSLNILKIVAFIWHS